MREKDVVISYIRDLIDEKTAKIYEYQESRHVLLLRMSKLSEAIEMLEGEIQQLEALRVVDPDDNN